LYVYESTNLIRLITYSSYS